MSTGDRQETPKEKKEKTRKEKKTTQPKNRKAKINEP